MAVEPSPEKNILIYNPVTPISVFDGHADGLRASGLSKDGSQ